MAITESARIVALLEREALLDVLRTALTDAGAGDGAHLFVGGEAGVGKTALTRRFVDDAGRDSTTLWGRCDPLVTPPPLGPRPRGRSRRAAGRRRLGDPRRRPHAVAAALLAAGEHGLPLVVVLEDVHWGDEATLDVLRSLGRRVGGR